MLSYAGNEADPESVSPNYKVARANSVFVTAVLFIVSWRDVKKMVWQFSQELTQILGPVRAHASLVKAMKKKKVSNSDGIPETDV